MQAVFQSVISPWLCDIIESQCHHAIMMASVLSHSLGAVTAAEPITVITALSVVLPVHCDTFEKICTVSLFSQNKLARPWETGVDFVMGDFFLTVGRWHKKKNRGSLSTQPGPSVSIKTDWQWSNRSWPVTPGLVQKSPRAQAHIPTDH